MDATVFSSERAGTAGKGDIVFYERPGGQFVVHRICRVHADGYDIIGDAQTEIEHHVQRKQIFARVTKVERKEKYLYRERSGGSFLHRSGFALSRFVRF